MTTFMEMLQKQWDQGKSVCVGLDSDPSKLPNSRTIYRSRHGSHMQGIFNKVIVDMTKDLVCAYKPNLAFYTGAEGKSALRETIEYIKSEAPEVPVILDAKQADIGSTNAGYVQEDFEWFGADAVTVHPYLGMEAMRPFLDKADKGIIVLVKTSNPGSGEFQDLVVDDEPLFKRVARNVSTRWNYNGNCAVVVGATYTDQLRRVRRLIGDMPILIPGIGAQGGDLESTVLAGRNSNNQGMIINSSRGIIFASEGNDFADVARSETQKLHNAITDVLKRAANRGAINGSNADSDK